MTDQTAVMQKKRPRAGRPTREQAQKRHEELLDQALEIFLEKGFELTTVDQIASVVGMSKQTVYNLYPEKTALFKAVVYRAIDRWVIPIEDIRAIESDDLEETLMAVARKRVANIVSPAGLRLQRILNAESYRFPELFEETYKRGTLPIMEYLADLFRRHMDTGRIYVEKPEIAAAAFHSMVVGGPVRGNLQGKAVKKKALDERTRYCVRLFLGGIRAC